MAYGSKISLVSKYPSHAELSVTSKNPKTTKIETKIIWNQDLASTATPQPSPQGQKRTANQTLTNLVDSFDKEKPSGQVPVVVEAEADHDEDEQL